MGGEKLGRTEWGGQGITIIDKTAPNFKNPHYVGDGLMRAKTNIIAQSEEKLGSKESSSNKSPSERRSEPDFQQKLAKEVRVMEGANSYGSRNSEADTPHEKALNVTSMVDKTVDQTRIFKRKETGSLENIMEETY